MIPLQLVLLNRIKKFSVSNNLLSGPIPIPNFGSTVTVESYANNLGLCGGPLKARQDTTYETDIYCLQTIKDSLEDPYNYLSSSWNFESNTKGFICKFISMESWRPDENRVLNISLSDMGLKGEFPCGFENCKSLMGLDLSRNKLSGSIPNDISNKLQFVTHSSNSFWGEIPSSLVNCMYLNVLKLDHNQLTGMIPLQLVMLTRIKKFSVSNNLLSGPVPNFGSTVTAKSYANNPGLCGGPLKARQDTTYETDIYCLQTIKDSLEDPYNYLSSSWNFENNNTKGFICKFIGVECWRPDENRVLNISLSDMGLKGEFPRGFENCKSLMGLDLSRNKLSGSIPNDISDKLQFVTYLDLSFNSFSGEIPISLANCTYMDVLKLDHNQLTGMIPPELAMLAWIKKFNVSNNLMSGLVPSFDSTVTAESYANNTGLCGGPLKSCQDTTKNSHIGIIAASEVGGVTFIFGLQV